MVAWYAFIGVKLLNRLTTIRVLAGSKNSHPVGFLLYKE